MKAHDITRMVDTVMHLTTEVLALKDANVRLREANLNLRYEAVQNENQMLNKAITEYQQMNAELDAKASSLEEDVRTLVAAKA